MTIKSHFEVKSQNEVEKFNKLDIVPLNFYKVAK